MKYFITLISVLLLTACAQSQYESIIKEKYFEKNWLKYDPTEQSELSGYQLVTTIKTVDNKLDEVFEHYGTPDYVRVPNHRSLNLAYLNKCIVLVYGVNTLFAPYVYMYNKVNWVTPELKAEFEKQCSTL